MPIHGVVDDGLEQIGEWNPERWIVAPTPQQRVQLEVGLTEPGPWAQRRILVGEGSADSLRYGRLDRRYSHCKSIHSAEPQSRLLLRCLAHRLL